MEARGRRRFFISCAHDSKADEALRAWFAQSLAKAGHDVFIDEMIEFGSKWADQIEQQLSTCDFFLLLLSEHALRSEMVLQELERARDRQRSSGVPRLLTIRVNLQAPLPYRWGAYLDSYQSKTWRDHTDSEPILRAILAVAGGEVEISGDLAPTPNDQALSDEDFSRPSPSVDLGAVVAPGGALSTKDPFYVSRKADTEILEFAQRAAETVVIKAPRQMGKSSLLKRYLLRCHEGGKRIALIDLSLLSDTDLAEYPTFLTCLAIDMLDKLELDLPEKPRIEGQPDLTYFIQKKVLAAVQQPVVVAFDEVDRILGQPYQAGFFSMLRYWHERRTDPVESKRGWARMELALIISTEPYLLIDDSLRSPFNIRPPIELQPFSLDECRWINERYGKLLTEGEVARLHELLGGQPYLTRLAYYHIARKDGLSFAELVRTAHEPGGPFGDHLRSLLSKLLKNPMLGLLAAMRQVIEHGTSPAGAFERLSGAGLVRMESGRARPMNEVYSRFFRIAS